MIRAHGWPAAADAPASSYRLGVRGAALHRLYPEAVTEALRAALASGAPIPAWFSGATGESPVDGSSDDAWPQAAYRETVDDEPTAADGENGRDSGGEPAGRGGIWEAP